MLGRVFKARGGPGESSSLWDHTALVYMMNFFFVCIPFRSAIIHPVSEVLRNAEIARFVFISVLCIVTISVRKGNDARDRKSTRLNSSHKDTSRMPSSA